MSCKFYFIFNFFVPKAYFLKVLDGALFIWTLWVFLLELPNLKHDINYIKYKFSHRFGKVFRWLNMYYSKIKIITFKKVTTMSIWIILNNLVWTCKKCNSYWYQDTIACNYLTLSCFNMYRMDLNTHCFGCILDMNHPITWWCSFMNLAWLIVVDTSCTNFSNFPKVKLVKVLNKLGLATWLLKFRAHLHWSPLIVHVFLLILLCEKFPSVDVDDYSL
jgi:hypothetical protein